MGKIVSLSQPEEWAPSLLDWAVQNGNPDPRAAMASLCRSLWLKHPSVPTNLGSIGALLGQHGETKFSIPGGRPGMSIFVDGGFQTLINSDDPPHRQHFSRAHEIVHSLLSDLTESSPAEADGIERLCEYGAAVLTMPEEPFLSHLGQHEISTESFRNLGSIFGTSAYACGRRAVELASAPLLFCRFDGDRSDGPPVLVQAFQSRTCSCEIEESALNDLEHHPTILSAHRRLTESNGVFSLLSATYSKVVTLRLSALGYRLIYGGQLGRRRTMGLLQPVLA